MNKFMLNENPIVFLFRRLVGMPPKPRQKNGWEETGFSFKNKPTNFDEVMARSTSPDPLWLRSKGITLSSKQFGELRWEESNKLVPDSNRVFLATKSGERILAMFKFPCFVLPFGKSELFVWYQKRSSTKYPTTGPVQLFMLDIDKLGPIEQPHSACKQMDSKEAHAFYVGGAASSIEIPSDLLPGKHSFHFPKEFIGVGELLILGRSNYREPEDKIESGNNLCLFIARPGEDSVEVVPQNWYNKGDFDHFYQWVTCVARDSKTGKIFGQGVRLPSFILDDSKRQIESWVK